MALHVKKGDTVEVIAGEHKGATGKVLHVLTASSRVIVAGINRRYKHVKQSRKHPQGGRVQMEEPIHISSVLPVNPKSSKGTRVRFELDGKGGKKRIAADGTTIGVVTRSV